MKWILGIGVIAVAITAMTMLNFGDSMVYFYTPAEALAKEKNGSLKDKTFKVGGLVKVGSLVKHDRDIAFRIVDTKGSQIHVVYGGLAPDMFKEGQGVVVEGRWSKHLETKRSENGMEYFVEYPAIVAKNLMVKHSEEYKKPEDHSTMNRALLERSIFK